MALEEAEAFLEQRKADLQVHQDLLEQNLYTLGSLVDSEVEGFMQTHAAEARNFHNEQGKAWASFTNAKGDATVQAVTTPTSAVPQALFAKLAAMGGRPALGGGMVLPKVGPAHTLALNSTNSPAAAEVARARGGAFQPAPATPEPAPREQPQPAWMTQLCKPRSTVGSGNRDDGNLDPPRGLSLDSELASALARRRQTAD